MSSSDVVSEFSHSDYRVYIKMRLRLGVKAADIFHELQVIAGSNAPSKSTVYEWAQRFNAGRTSTEDDSRSGCPLSAVTKDSIARVHSVVVEDPHATLDEIAAEVGVSHGTCHAILTEHLQYKKLCARWVPHDLSEAQKEERVDLARSLSNKLRRWGKEGIKDLATGDETYCHFEEPGHRLQRTTWVHKGDPPSTCTRQSTFTPKALYTIFFSSEGLLVKLLAPPNSTVSGTYYSQTVLPELLSAFQKHHPNHHLHLHHDNAPAHRCGIVLDYIHENNIEIIPHPPYSPDLAPADFWLFPLLKSQLSSHTFSSRHALGLAVGNILSAVSEHEWSAFIPLWQKRLKLCVEHGGNYFEHTM